MAIKAVIWDNAGVLGNVVGDSFPHLWAERLGVPVEDVIRVLTDPDPKGGLWDLGEISKDEYFDFFIQNIGLPLERKAALELSVDDFYYDKELLAYIRGLKDRFTLALLSVMPLYIQEVIETKWPDFTEVFDHMIVSCYVHLVKPDPRIYRLTLKRIGCKAEEAVFIDDTEENVIAAEKLGIRSILFKNREQAIREVESIITSR
jgi:epoxide hydrolase-like predicted phosphatase